MQGSTEAAEDDLDPLDGLDFRPPVIGVEEGAAGGDAGPGDGGGVGEGAGAGPSLRSSLNPPPASTPIGINPGKPVARILNKKEREKKIKKENQ